MKTFVKETVSVTIKPQINTKQDLKRAAKLQLNDVINRPDKLVKVYFEAGLDEFLHENMKNLKNTNGIEKMLYCFEQKDTDKMVSFLRQVFDLPYFCQSLKGLTPNLFVNMLIDLCTTKAGQTKKIKFERVNPVQEIMYLGRPNSFEVETKFNPVLIQAIFEAYI
jgi:hypothetical protein